MHISATSMAELTEDELKSAAIQVLSAATEAFKGGTTEISVSPGDRRKSPSSRPWRAGYSDPNKKIFILEDGKIHCVNFSLQAR